MLFFIGMLLPTLELYDRLVGFTKPTVVKPGDRAFMAFVLVPFILGIVAFAYQKRQLRFTRLDTIETKVHNRKLIEEISKKLKWSIIASREEIFIAVTNPPFWSGSWGERITVLYDKNAILVNSICDPNKQPSLVSCGRNNANIRAVIRKVKNPAKKSFVT